MPTEKNIRVPPRNFGSDSAGREKIIWEPTNMDTILETLELPCPKSKNTL